MRKFKIKRPSTLDEQIVYESEIRKFDSEINLVQKDLGTINEDERNTLVEFEIFLDTLRNSASAYKKASYVRKRSMIDLFISNVYVDKKKRLTLEVKPDLRHFFSGSFGDDGVRTHV